MSRLTGHRVLAWALVLTVAAESFIATASTSLMPTIVEDIGGRSVYALAFALFNVALLVGLVLGGRASDSLGPAPVLLGGTGLHIMGLVGAAISPAFAWLVVARVLQGTGTGLCTVAIYVLIATVYSERERGRVFAMMASGWALPGLLGPVLGGLLADAVSWRAVFSAMPVVEVAVLAVAAPTLWAIHRRPTPHREADPLLRTICAVAVLAVGVAVVSALDLFPIVARWPVLAGGLVAIGAGARPLLPRGSLRMEPGLPAGIVLRGCIGGLFAGAQYLIPLALSEGRGFSATEAGLALSCGVVGFSVGGFVEVWAGGGRGPVAGRTTAWLTLLTVGMALAAVGLVPAAPVAAGYVGWGMAGVGFGAATTGLNLFVLELSPPAERGVNSAAMRMTDAVSASAMVSLGGALLAGAGTASGASDANAAALVVGLMAVGFLACVGGSRRLLAE